VLIGSSGERLEEMGGERSVVRQELGLEYVLMVPPVALRYNTCPGKSK